MRRCTALGLLVVLLFTAAAPAETHETRIQLRDGRLQTAELSSALLKCMHLPGVGVRLGPVESIDVSGLAGSRFVAALNQSLGDGCQVELQNDALVLRADPQKLPRNFDSIRAAARVFTSVAAPKATANQRRLYSLHLPRDVDGAGRLVVLVHGLDCNRSNWTTMGELLAAEGYQVAFFSYPSDQPLEESAELFSQNMQALRDAFPSLRVDVLAHSMGSLVARRYVEGDSYTGGVDRLILLGPPNLGSRWAAYRIALELEEHWGLWRHEPDWSPTWMITDGLGEAGRDLRPGSRFLTSLNAQPRREGVKYTIIAGNQHPVWHISADAMDGTANLIPRRATNWWGFRQTDRWMHKTADKLRQRTGKSDGPVVLASTRLAGVEDHVVIPADHNTMYLSEDGRAPVAWDQIRQRLANESATVTH